MKIMETFNINNKELGTWLSWLSLAMSFFGIKAY